MSHVTAIETFARQLEDLGSPLTEAQIITKITCTLPPSFRPLLSAWENLETSKKTLQLLTARLIKEESMNKIFEIAARQMQPFSPNSLVSSQKLIQVRCLISK